MPGKVDLTWYETFTRNVRRCTINAIERGVVYKVIAIHTIYGSGLGIRTCRDVGMLEWQREVWDLQKL